MSNWYPGAPNTGSYYPSYTGGYAPPMSDQTAPPINSVGGMVSKQGIGTVGWGLALLALAFIVMHMTDRED